MPMSSNQTTFCYDYNLNISYITSSCCPVIASGKSKLITKDGNMYFKLKNRIVCITAENILQEWYNKPTLNSAIKDKRKGCFYNFGKDGSVYMTDAGSKYMEWSFPIETTYIDGDTLNGRFDEDINEYIRPIPCRNCRFNCEGCDYEYVQFCSKLCMNQYTSDY
jgi:hypothetical protein